MKRDLWPVAALLVLFPWQLAAQSGRIEVRIADPAQVPAAATFRLERLGGGVRVFATNPPGEAAQGALEAGRYVLSIQAPGFATETLLVELGEGETLTRSVTLRLAPAVTEVRVTAATPLPSAEADAEALPARVQSATAESIERSGALDVSDFLNRRMTGVFVNEVQGNPLQADLNYRGYTASPLLGTPQGLAVYLDGMRLNQPFGDVVSWDLIPRSAISEVTLVPGSNPLFGLNALGGSVALRAKDGIRHAGTVLQLNGGSFGRKSADLQHGGWNRQGLDWFAASTLLFEDGWRESSPSDVRQFAGRLGWHSVSASAGLTASFANNSLTGNGLQEDRFLQRDYRSVYTKPDVTNNRSPMVAFNFQRRARAVSLAANAYFRDIATGTLNGDINEESLNQQLYQPNARERDALAAAGLRGFPLAGANALNTPFPSWRCIANALLRDEPAEKCNGLLNRSRTAQHHYGASGQATWEARHGSLRSQITAGGGTDRSRTSFAQSTQLGYLNPDRSVTGVDAFGDGVSGGDVDGEPYDTRVDLVGVTETASAFASGTLNWERLSVTASGRFQRASIDNQDRVRPSGSGSLSGRHRFQRLNPAIGWQFRSWRGTSAYFNYAEGSRAPTSIELGCADPAQPCKLPNAMAGDPPLGQVVTRTLEAGLRAGGESSWRWSAGWFRAENANDILFVASEQTGFGYFKNFGQTRRQGLEADFSARVGRVTFGGGYTFLDATFQSPEEVGGAGNSFNEDAQDGAPGMEGTIEIEPGNRIPLTPRHSYKGFATIQATQRLKVDLGTMALSSQFARGNENNRHQADGTYYLSSGQTSAFAVVNAGARYQLTRRVELTLQVNNLLDRRFYTAAQLGPTGFTAAGNFIARPLPPIGGEYPVAQSTFFAPGAPRAAWGSLRYRF
jgi:outer membrane receptor protein involved in Fe transport